MAEQEKTGELRVKIKLPNGVDFEGSSTAPGGGEWLRKLVETFYVDFKKGEEGDMIQGGYTAEKKKE